MKNYFYPCCDDPAEKDGNGAYVPCPTHAKTQIGIGEPSYYVYSGNDCIGNLFILHNSS